MVLREWKKLTHLSRERSVMLNVYDDSYMHISYFSQTPLNAEHLQINVAAAISLMPHSSSGAFSSSSLRPRSAIEKLQTY
uniref:Uncharacterized protein n=1 Tax=Tanacetum cinerariifolium TaxID=118510 RepID=A0A699KJH8_TANCI|nr:hypothetical protein [Tanacetum cinerariifolium]